VLEAAEQDIRSLSQAGETAIQTAADVGFRVQDGILQPPFDIPMAIFFWIEFRRIPWQVLSMNLWMFLQVGRHDFRSMNRGSIPNQDHGSMDVPPKMFQANDQFLGIDRTIEMPFENLTRNRQTDHRRCLPTKLGDPLQLGRLTFWRPGEADRFGIRKAKFIFKHDLCAESPRFFLSGANRVSTKPGSVLHRAR